MKKKIISLCLVICLLAVAVVGGTMAYFTDTDEATNVFTVGNIDISLEEKFPDHELMPGERYKNNLQKEVYVVNDGDNDAYMWIEVLIPSSLDDGNTIGEPAPGIGNNLHFNYFDTYNVGGELKPYGGAEAAALGYGNPVEVIDQVWMGEEKIDGVLYNKYLHYEKAAGAADKKTPALLAQVYMDKDVKQCTDNGHEDNCLVLMDGKTHYTGSWELIVRGYGIQAEGFANITEAINAYYGTTVIK